MAVLLCGTVIAQAPVAAKVKTCTLINANSSLPTFATFNKLLTDTLKSADTLFYKVPVIHTGIGWFYVTLKSKLVASDTTSTVSFWQSYDGSTWFAVNAISSTYTASAYTATVAKSTTANTEFSFWQNNVRFDSQYLGIRFIAKTKSSFKTLYSGTIRYLNER